MRLAIGCLGAAGAWVATGELRLGAEMFRRLAVRDDFKLGLRRGSWYARRGWPGLNVSRDPIFVFCHDMDSQDLVAVRRFLDRRGPRSEPGLHQADLAYVSAVDAVRKAGTPTFGTALDRFAKDADRLLATIAEPSRSSVSLPRRRRQGGLSPANAQMALRDMADLLDRNGIRWFILSGTFLGVIRDGGFLPHDDDIDLGVLAEDTDVPGLLHVLKGSSLFRAGQMETQASFERDVQGRLQLREHPVLLTAGHRNGVKLDIFVHHRDGDVIWHASGLRRWDNSAFDLTRYELAGVPVMGPADADRYLTENYGQWRVPIVEFNSAIDTPNQHLVQSPLSVATTLRRVWLQAAQNPKGAAALMRDLEHAGLLCRDPSHPGGLRFNHAAFAP